MREVFRVPVTSEQAGSGPRPPGALPRTPGACRRGLPSPGLRGACSWGLRAPASRLLPNRPEAALGLPGLPAPDPGNFLYAQKVTKKAPGRPRTPNFSLIGRYQRRYPVATEFPLACWPLVIGTEGIQLRLTALGMGPFLVVTASQRLQKPNRLPPERGGVSKEGELPLFGRLKERVL